MSKIALSSNFDSGLHKKINVNWQAAIHESTSATAVYQSDEIVFLVVSLTITIGLKFM